MTARLSALTVPVRPNREDPAKMNPLRRRAATAAAGLLLVPALAACGFSAQTDQDYQPAVGTNDRDGDLDVLNATVVSGTDGEGTFAGTLVNNSDKAVQLTGITGSGVEVSAKSEVPADGLVNLATDGKVVVTGDAVKAGEFVNLTFTFSNGQSTKLLVPIVAHAGDYADVPVPSAEPSAALTPSDKQSPTDPTGSAPAH